jgi:hypothetical protein
MKTITEELAGSKGANKHNDNDNNNNCNNNNGYGFNDFFVAGNTKSFKLNLNNDPAPPSSTPRPQGAGAEEQLLAKLPNVAVVTLRDPAKIRANLLSANRKRFDFQTFKKTQKVG